MLAEKLIPHIDTVLRTLFAPATTSRPYPDAGIEEGELNEAEKRHARQICAAGITNLFVSQN